MMQHKACRTGYKLRIKVLVVHVRLFLVVLVCRSRDICTKGLLEWVYSRITHLHLSAAPLKLLAAVILLL